MSVKTGVARVILSYGSLKQAWRSNGGGGAETVSNIRGQSGEIQTLRHLCPPVTDSQPWEISTLRLESPQRGHSVLDTRWPLNGWTDYCPPHVAKQERCQGRFERKTVYLRDGWDLRDRKETRTTPQNYRVPAHHWGQTNHEVANHFFKAIFIEIQWFLVLVTLVSCLHHVNTTAINHQSIYFPPPRSQRPFLLKI